MTRRICGLLAVVVLVACGDARAAEGGATPDAAFDAFKTAMQAKDYKKGFAQTTPDSQEMMVGTMGLGLTVMSMQDPTKGADIDAMFAKHGVKKVDLRNPTAIPQDPKALIKFVTADVKDKPAAIADIMQWMEKNAPPAQQQQAAANMEKFGQAKMSDLNVTGDTATAKITSNVDGNENSNEVAFRKVGDVWFLDFAAMAEKAMGAPGGVAPGP